ncbi:MAG: signal peptidase I [Clostridia bacterium]
MEVNNLKIKKILLEIGEWVLCFVIAYILYLLLNYFVGAISGVKQVSMYPTAKEGEKLLIQRPTIFKKELKHGDIITFEAPIDKAELVDVDKSDPSAVYDEYTGFNAFLYSFMDIGKTSYVKRVIGIAGDHIVITEAGEVFRNDKKLEESYLRDGKTNKIGDYTDIIVPKDTVFAMGDNRLQSKDCREFGCIPINKVNGYVIMRVWPFSRWGKV